MKLTITIQGLNEAITFTSRFPGLLKNGIRSELSMTGDKGVQIYQKHAHVITGNMKSKIKKTRVNEKELEITAQAKYSGYENRRGGPHAFFDIGTKELTEVAQKQFSNMIKRTISQKGSI